MDVRFSPGLPAPRDLAAQFADRLGPHAIGELDDRERAAGWRERRAANDDSAPWASGVEVGIVADTCDGPAVRKVV